MNIDKVKAKKILEHEALQADLFEIEGGWVKTINHLCNLSSNSKTMIAMLGTAILAKATEISVDVFSLKVGKDVEGTSYSARALCKEVLAAEATRLGYNIGVTGREPLNNQPFFGKERVTRALNVKSNAKAALEALVDALEKLDKIKTETEAKKVLRAYIQVRKVAKTKIKLDLDSISTSAFEISSIIEKFVKENSENGKRAQAVVAGMLDCMFTEQRVKVGKINDPSRDFPGDVAVYSAKGKIIERVFEVRDKPVTVADARSFISKCHEKEILVAGIVGLSNQVKFDLKDIIQYGEERNIRFGIYLDIPTLFNEINFWSSQPGVLSKTFLERISIRSEELEVSENGLLVLNQLLRGS